MADGPVRDSIVEWTERPSDVAVHTTPEELRADRRRPHIWIGDLDEMSVGGKYELLSLDERERAAFWADPAERHRFLASCIFLREVIGQVAGAPPERLRFIEGRSGRPVLAPQGVSARLAHRLRFSCSRSDRALALAISLGTDVGVGLRIVRPLDLIDKIAETRLTPEESEQLKRLPENDFVREFSRLWSHHEAIASLGGTTLLRPPRPAVRPVRTTSFEFALDNHLVVGSMAVGR